LLLLLLLLLTADTRAAASSLLLPLAAAALPLWRQLHTMLLLVAIPQLMQRHTCYAHAVPAVVTLLVG
jgi:hypothetical protein